LNGGFPFLNPVALCDQSTFKNDSSLLVPLVFLSRKLINPSELRVTVFARNIANHVASCQHDAILHFTVGQIDDFTEKECPPSGSSESSTYQLGSIGEDGVAGGTGKETIAPWMLQKHSSHLYLLIVSDSD